MLTTMRTNRNYSTANVEDNPRNSLKNLSSEEGILPILAVVFKRAKTTTFVL